MLISSDAAPAGGTALLQTVFMTRTGNGGDASRRHGVQATASGLYIVEKIDLLVAYLIAVPVARWLASYFPNVRS